MFSVLYSRTEYDIVPEDQIEILFKDCCHEKNYREHKTRASKVMKQKLETKAHKRTIADDDLKVMKRKLERKAHKRTIVDDALKDVYLLTPQLSKRKFIY